MTRFSLLGAALLLAAGCSDAHSSAANAGSVSGHVSDALGAGFAGVTVRLGAAIVETDAHGAFSFAEAPTHYDLALTGPVTFARFYHDLSSRKPELNVGDVASLEPERHSAQLTVNVPDADTDSLASDVAIDLEGASGVQIEGPSDRGKARTYFVNWRGNNVTLHLIALQYERTTTSCGPTKYVGWGELRQPLIDNALVSWNEKWQSVPFDTTSLDLQADMPADYAAFQVFVKVHLRPTGKAVRLLAADCPKPGSVLVPKLDGATYDLELCAAGANGASTRTVLGLTHAGPVPITIEAAAVLEAPLSGGTVAAGDTLRWSGGSGLGGFIYLIPKTPSADAPNFKLFFDKSVTSTKVPDFGDLGLGLPDKVAYQWAVFTITSDGIEALAAHDGVDDTKPSTYAYASYADLITRAGK